jgi:transcriptional regulator with XRE-family HTH domain
LYDTDESNEEAALPTIGDNLRRIRKMRRMGQVELGERSGVAQQTISGIERGHREPHPSTLKKLGDVLNVPVAAFFQEKALPKAPHTAMPSDEFDELRQKASTGQIAGSALLEAMQREYDALDNHYWMLLEQGDGVDAAEMEEALGLLVEARKRWRVVMFDRAEESIALDERRDPTRPERADTRLLPLDEADERIRSVARTPA